MFTGTNGPSLADIAAVTGNDRNNGFGGEGGWWVLIILFALFGGWGGNGFGANGGTALQQAATQADIQRGFDTQAVISKLDGINAGLSNLGYDQLSQMNNINTNVMQTGFGINNAVMETGFGLSNAITQTGFGIAQQIGENTVAGMQNTNLIQGQIAECGCANREAINNLRFDLSQSSCHLSHAISDSATAIMQNNDYNFRALHDEIEGIRLEQKNEQIANLKAEVQALNLASSQCAQNAYLISQLRPAAVPAYTVASPYSCGCCYNG